jgi:hypothetical protein
MGGLTASLYTGSVLVMSLVCGVAAFALYPIISNCVELGCEIVYPIGEVQLNVNEGNINGYNVSWRSNNVIHHWSANL